MHPRLQTIKELKALGFVFDREGANHELYTFPKTNKSIPIKRHKFTENTRRYILKEAQRIIKDAEDKGL